MMDLIIHFLLSLVVIFFFKLELKDALLFMGANLIDIDHLFSTPVYEAERNSFETHLLHQVWLPLSVGSVIIVAKDNLKEYMWLGIGILFHFTLDWIDVLWV